MYSYIRYVVLRSQPISSVEDPGVRSFCKHDVEFSRKVFKETLFKLVELVEKAIRREMEETRGALLHDGWSYNSTHFVGILAAYNREVSVVRNGRVGTERILYCPLLSVSPMGKVGVKDTDDETTDFSAKVHALHIKEILPYYGVQVEDWAVCQIVDNCTLNKKVSKLLGIPMVGCHSHRLHLAARTMCEDDTIMASLLSSIGDTMRDCKGKLRNRAILRNLSALSPILPNETRWYGMYRMLRRFNQLRNTIIQVSRTEGARVSVNASQLFYNRSRQYENILAQIN